jgi:hypothetical protein
MAGGPGDVRKLFIFTTTQNYFGLMAELWEQPLLYHSLEINNFLDDGNQTLLRVQRSDAGLSFSNTVRSLSSSSGAPGPLEPPGPGPLRPRLASPRRFCARAGRPRRPRVGMEAAIEVYCYFYHFIYLFSLEPGCCYVAQAGLELPDLSDPPVPVARIPEYLGVRLGRPPLIS